MIRLDSKYQFDLLEIDRWWKACFNFSLKKSMMLIFYAFYLVIDRFLNFDLVCFLGNSAQDSPDEIGFWWTEAAWPVTRPEAQKLQTELFRFLVMIHPGEKTWIVRCSPHLLAYSEHNFIHHSVPLFLQSLHWGISLLCSLPLHRYLVIDYLITLPSISYFCYYAIHLSPYAISVCPSVVKSIFSMSESPDSWTPCPLHMLSSSLITFPPISLFFLYPITNFESIMLPYFALHCVSIEFADLVLCFLWSINH